MNVCGIDAVESTIVLQKGIFASMDGLSVIVDTSRYPPFCPVVIIMGADKGRISWRRRRMMIFLLRP
jgi:hypothetical protein